MAARIECFGGGGRLHRVLAEVGVEHDVKEYPEAGHGFVNDHDGAGDRTPLLFAVLGKLSPGADDHEASALDARRRIIAFFAAHLKGVVPASGCAAPRHIDVVVPSSAIACRPFVAGAT